MNIHNNLEHRSAILLSCLHTRTVSAHVEFRLQTLDLSILRGTIGEHLARSFIRHVLGPRLVDDEGWDHVLLSHNYDYKQHAQLNRLFSFDRFRDDFLVHGFYADRKLLTHYANAVDLLLRNHCRPDGLLLKLQEAGKTKRLQRRAYPRIASLRRETAGETKDSFEVPVVGGGLEVVEVKCGRQARLNGKQKETYNTLIAKGVPLRLITVRIVSFDQNRFLVEEHRYDRFV